MAKTGALSAKPAPGFSTRRKVAGHWLNAIVHHASIRRYIAAIVGRSRKPGRVASSHALCFTFVPMSGNGEIDTFIAHWRDTGGSELANTQSFLNGLCTLIGVAPPQGSRTHDAHNDYVFERRAFNGKRAATVRSVLDALAGIGMARRLEDGRYAA